MKDYFETPFWINSFEELYILYEKNKTLPCDEQNLKLNNDVEELLFLFKKKFGKNAFEYLIEQIGVD